MRSGETTLGNNKPFVMSISDDDGGDGGGDDDDGDDESEEEVSEDGGLIAGTRFSCNDLDLRYTCNSCLCS